MAKAVYHVVYAVQSAGLGLDGLAKEYTKAEAEAIDPRLKEVSVVRGPVQSCRVVEVEAENAAQAAILVKKVVCGPGGQAAEKFVTVKTTEWKEETP
jgi:hypothetical protein